MYVNAPDWHILYGVYKKISVAEIEKVLKYQLLVSLFVYSRGILPTWALNYVYES